MFTRISPLFKSPIKNSCHWFGHRRELRETVAESRLKWRTPPSVQLKHLSCSQRGLDELCSPTQGCFSTLDNNLQSQTEETTARKCPQETGSSCPSFVFTEHCEVLTIIISWMSRRKGFSDGSGGKESACNAGDAGDVGLIPGSGRSPRVGKWQPTPGFSPGESHGQRRLAGHGPWGQMS